MEFRILKRKQEKIIIKNQVMIKEKIKGVRRAWSYLAILVMLSLFMSSCGTTDNLSRADVSTYEELERIVKERKAFAIENQWASPMSGERVNLIGNSNYIRMNGDRVEIFLPYFGVRHSGGAYNAEGGIKYEGPVKNLRFEENPRNIVVKFEGQQGSEDLNFMITMFPGGNTITNVNSSERQSISYQGKMKELPEQKM